HTKVVNVGVRDSTYVLDGLLYHESDLRIEEHYTDTAGFTDHVGSAWKTESMVTPVFATPILTTSWLA
ncbi:Tn3 family transposase, partial [Enterobacter hormaechei]